jgi:hypothetical protein
MSYLCSIHFVQLTREHKCNHLTVCQGLLSYHHNKNDALLGRHIVIMDEIWIHHYAPESKRQSMEWKHQKSLVMRK